MRASYQQMSAQTLDTLPRECLLCVLQHLSGNDLLSMACTSTALHVLCLDNMLWRSLAVNAWGDLVPAIPPLPPTPAASPTCFTPPASSPQTTNAFPKGLPSEGCVTERSEMGTIPCAETHVVATAGLVAAATVSAAGINAINAGYAEAEAKSPSAAAADTPGKIARGRRRRSAHAEATCLRNVCNDTNIAAGKAAEGKAAEGKVGDGMHAAAPTLPGPEPVSHDSIAAAAAGAPAGDGEGVAHVDSTPGGLGVAMNAVRPAAWWSYCRHRSRALPAPHSTLPLDLCQEHYPQPWHHIAACIMCSRTGAGPAVRAALAFVLHAWPTPSALLHACDDVSGPHLFKASAAQVSPAVQVLPHQAAARGRAAGRTTDISASAWPNAATVPSSADGRGAHARQAAACKAPNVGTAKDAGNADSAISCATALDKDAQAPVSSGGGKQAVLCALRPLGLQEQRLHALLDAAEGFLMRAWHDPSEFYGCGRFVSDSWRLMCKGDASNIQDAKLQRHAAWLRATEDAAHAMQPVRPGGSADATAVARRKRGIASKVSATTKPTQHTQARPAKGARCASREDVRTPAQADICTPESRRRTLGNRQQGR